MMKFLGCVASASGRTVCPGLTGSIQGFARFLKVEGIQFPKGPCAQVVYTLAPKYLKREYFMAKVYASWVHGTLEIMLDACPGILTM